jgi:2,3-bisphosphoglycerate-independent phosphoglycerate mutase
VPLVVIGKGISNETYQLEKGGKLCDIAPTVLSLLELSLPHEMTGRSLLRKKAHDKAS